MGLLCYNMNCPKVRNGIAISCDCAEAEECTRFDGVKPKIDEPYSMEDKIRPAHYQGKHECIELMIAMYGEYEVMCFCKLNAFKYRFRAGKKPGFPFEEDIKKAEFYEDKYMELWKKIREKYE